MPANVVKTPEQERLWNKAKVQAEKQGHANDYAYIMGIFKQMGGMTKSLFKAFIVPTVFKRQRIPGQVPSKERMELMRTVTEKPPSGTIARLLQHDGPVFTAQQIVDGLGFDMRKSAEWATFLEDAINGAPNELIMRQSVLAKCQEANLDGVLRLAILQRSLTYFRELRKSMVEVVTVDELQKAKYTERTGTPGNYKYKYAKKKDKKPVSGIDEKAPARRLKKLAPGQAKLIAGLSDDARRLFNDLVSYPGYHGGLSTSQAKVELKKKGLIEIDYATNPKNDVAWFTKKGQKIVDKIRTDKEKKRAAEYEAEVKAEQKEAEAKKTWKKMSYKELAALPIGSVLKYEIVPGDVVTAVKQKNDFGHEYWQQYRADGKDAGKRDALAFMDERAGKEAKVEIKKSFVLIKAQAREARGGDYIRRVARKSGRGYTYYYNEDEYNKRKDAHIDGKGAQHRYISGHVQKCVEGGGKKGCDVSAFRDLVKKYGAKRVSKVLKENVNGGSLAFKKGRFSLPKKKDDQDSGKAKP